MSKSSLYSNVRIYYTVIEMSQSSLYSNVRKDLRIYSEMPKISLYSNGSCLYPRTIFVSTHTLCFTMIYTVSSHISVLLKSIICPVWYLFYPFSQQTMQLRNSMKTPFLGSINLGGWIWTETASVRSETARLDIWETLKSSTWAITVYSPFMDRHSKVSPT